MRLVCAGVCLNYSFKKLCLTSKEIQIRFRSSIKTFYHVALLSSNWSFLLLKAVCEYYFEDAQLLVISLFLSCFLAAIAMLYKICYLNIHIYEKCFRNTGKSIQDKAISFLSKSISITWLFLILSTEKACYTIG